MVEHEYDERNSFPASMAGLNGNAPGPLKHFASLPLLVCGFDPYQITPKLNYAAGMVSISIPLNQKLFLQRVHFVAIRKLH